jgi:hypothetical protein
LIIRQRPWMERRFRFAISRLSFRIDIPESARGDRSSRD